MEPQPSHADENGKNTPSANVKVLKSSIDILDESHRDAVTRAVSRVLSTAIAETTYAQIVNGLPLPEVLNDVYGDILPHDHPIYQHTHLKEGTLSTLRRFRKECDPKVLQFDAALLSAFQATSPGSSTFQMRLIEIAAVAVHQVAVLLYQNNPDLSGPASATQAVHTWTPPRDDDRSGRSWWKFNPDGPPATLTRYPEGFADMAGYWAENRVLGGVVLFDREDARKVGAGPDAVYIHPDRDEVTYRICLLTNAQKKAPVDFILQDWPGTGPPSTVSKVETCLLPITPDETNTYRVDPEELFWYTGVYCDQWERAMPPPKWMGDGRALCVYNSLDFPTKWDQNEAKSRWRTKGRRM